MWASIWAHNHKHKHESKLRPLSSGTTYPSQHLYSQTPPSNTSPIRILNPILPENIEKFNITFFKENSIQIKTLTTLLGNHQHLSTDQWAETCITFDHIVNKILETIEKTCQADPLPNLTNRTSQQGGFLPRKLAKVWQRYLNTYHLIWKTIYIVQHDPLWQAHPILNDIRNHQYTSISHPPQTMAPPIEWIDTIAIIVKMQIKKPGKSPQDTPKIAL